MLFYLKAINNSQLYVPCVTKGDKFSKVFNVNEILLIRLIFVCFCSEFRISFDMLPVYFKVQTVSGQQTFPV